MHRWAAPTNFIAFAFLATTTPHAVAQQPDCSQVRAAPGTMGYQLRSADPRCEGFYQSTVSGATLEILSLTASPVDFELGNKTVEIIAPNVSGLNVAKIHVQARALPLSTYYRMDATLGSAATMHWPIGHVLAPANLTADTIGVLAWVDEGRDRIFVPISVSERPPSAPGGSSIVVILRSSADLDELRWRSWQAGSASISAWKKYSSTPRMLRAGGLLRLELESDKGTRVVEFAAKLLNSDRWLPLKFQIFEP